MGSRLADPEDEEEDPLLDETHKTIDRCWIIVHAFAICWIITSIIAVWSFSEGHPKRFINVFDSLGPLCNGQESTKKVDAIAYSDIGKRDCRNCHGGESSESSDDQANTTNTIWWTSNLRSNHVTVTNYIRANKSFNYNSSLTLTTQATIEFLYHTLELCKRWDGPISLAVYVPGNEFQVATTLIKYMRQCLPVPLSACIRNRVTWHFVYDKAHGPPPSSLGYPKEHLDSVNFPLFVEQDHCPKLAGPNLEDLIRQFEEELRKRGGLFPNNYRQQFKLTYPINVLRNTARLAASTKYVLASDIELYPSINLVTSFMNYISKHDIKQEYNYIDKFIFTLPIFEVKPTKSAPKTKSELVELMQQGSAIFFHKWVCDACQAFPNRLDWLQMDKFGEAHSQGHTNSDDEIIIFEITQRDKVKNSWEPIFIGTNDDPLYDDRLTWDGRRDKMGQMYEMCLQNYYLLVVGNAFLVHAPGIKHIDKNDVARRYNYMRDNNLIYDATMERLRKHYANSSNIGKC